MRERPLLPVVAIATLLLMLAVAATAYRQVQNQLELEANGLVSSKAVAVTGDISEALSRARQQKMDVSLFLSVSDDGTSRAVVSTSGLLEMIPTHNVRREVSDDLPGALVGSQLASKTNTIEILGREYEVAGELGAKDRSLVENEVLIYDPGLFLESKTQTFVIDGKDAAILSKQFDGARAIGAGLSRRTNVDVVSPVVTLLSNMLLILGAAFLGFLTNTWGQKQDMIAWRWGRSRARILARHLGAYGLAWVLIAAMGSAVIGAFDPSFTELVEYWKTVALLIGVFGVSLTVDFLVKKR